jgi:hypothetical protein
MRNAPRILLKACWHAATFGVLLLALSFAAYAQSGGPATGPTWETIALGAVGFVTALIGVYTRGVVGRLDRIEIAHAALEKYILTEHQTREQTRSDIRTAIKIALSEEMRPVLSQLAGIESQLRARRHADRLHQDDGA